MIDTIYWASLDNILYLPAFIIPIIGIFLYYYRAKKSYKYLCHPATQKIIFKNFSLKKLFFKGVLLSLALLFLLCALLQPQWGKKDEILIQEGRDVIFLLDISRSMLAQDLKPNRLDFAKLKIKNLLSLLSFERIGLIIFSGSAFVQCPLTSDHNAFLMYLDDIDAQSLSSGTTALDTALAKALEVFSVTPERKNKLVVTFTDGEDFSVNLEGVKQLASSQKIHFFTLGVGSPEGAPIPLFDSYGKSAGFEKESNGTIALSKLNETLLKNTSSFLDGTYVRATYDNSDINKISSLIKAFEKEKFSDKTISNYEDQYPWFLGIAWVLLALEWLL
jgi:Ca-activated chloride channel family protein